MGGVVGGSQRFVLSSPQTSVTARLEGTVDECSTITDSFSSYLLQI